MMARKLSAVALFALALAPSACVACRWRAMPHFGLHQDDALYLVGAQSLAEGHGYRIASLPGTPFQTKYPPMLSVLMAPLWRFGLGFPENLKLAMLFVWLMLPAALLAMRAMFRQFGLAEWEVCLLAFVAALHPAVSVLSTAIMSDLLFLAIFLASVVVAERALDPRRSAWLAFAAGALAGTGYLARTVALPLALTAPLCFLWRRQPRRAGLFLVGMLPPVLGWQVWTATHVLHTSDPALLYYTSYLGLQQVLVRADNLGLVLWHNADALLRALGKLLVFDVALVQNVHLERILGAAALAGAVRLVKRSGLVQYATAASGISALLLIHHFMPDERLALPLYPLVIMGFWTEMKNYGAVLRASWRRRLASDRVLVGTGAAALAATVIFLAACDVAGYARFLPSLYAACLRDLQAYRPAYSWIRLHTPPDSTFYAYDDPVLYLYTGRRTLGLPMPPTRVYSGDAERQADVFVRDVPLQARVHGLDYLLITTTDFYRERRAGLLLQVAAGDPRLLLEYGGSSAAVYRSVP